MNSVSAVCSMVPSWSQQTVANWTPTPPAAMSIAAIGRTGDCGVLAPGRHRHDSHFAMAAAAPAIARGLNSAATLRAWPRFVAARRLVPCQPLLVATMAGHSKWHNIRHRKAAVDAVRVRFCVRHVCVCVTLFSSHMTLCAGDPAEKDRQLPENLQCHLRRCQACVGCRTRCLYAHAHGGACADGGTDLSTNVRLSSALAQAKTFNVPKDVIERAINKASEVPEGLEDAVYEGYGTQGVAVVVETLTNNRSRTAPRMRHIFSKYGGGHSNARRACPRANVAACSRVGHKRVGDMDV